MSGAAMLAAGSALGLGLGWAYFSALRLNMRLWLARRGSPWRAALLHLGRLAGTAAALFAVAQLGAAALIGAAAGLTVASAVFQLKAARGR